jgi:hypothetical protein
VAPLGDTKLSLKKGCKIMRNRLKWYDGKRCGSVLALAVVALVVLSILGMGLLTISYGVRHQALMLENEATSMMVAEAGYEQAVFWMSQQQDVLTSVLNSAPGTTGTITFPTGYCNYSIALYTILGSRPIYRIVSNGNSGTFNRTVDVLVMQAISGWEMGQCRVPIGPATTADVYFISGEVIDMPLHINQNSDDNPYVADIYVLGDPQFLQEVCMGESRYDPSGGDKYSDIIGLFSDGIYFNQPASRITDEDSLQSQVDRFQNSTNPSYQFTPIASAPVPNPQPAVQLEFFVNNGVGEVRITNDCTVRGFEQQYNWETYDFEITPGSDPTTFQMYDLYAYHLMPQNADSTGERTIQPISQTYVAPSYGGVTAELGGQIFVNGNVIIGSNGNSPLPGTPNTVNGNITVVATGNIWIANSITMDGPHDANGVPTAGNPNTLGLIAQGVIKVVDPGMTNYSYVGDGGHPLQPNGFVYVPIGQPSSGQPANSDQRNLPNPLVVEAGITVGDGGWGAENVGIGPQYGGYGGRKGSSPIPSQDNLIVNGTITEACRGIVGLSGWNGYLKHYYLDSRLLNGILPGNVLLQGKYIPTPAGWHDYRSSN